VTGRTVSASVVQCMNDVSLKRIFMKDIFALEPYTKIPKNESYVVSYPYLIEYFKSYHLWPEM